MRSHLLSVVLVVAGFAVDLSPSYAQSIHPVDVDGKVINLAVPEGYCALDEGKPDQAALIDRYYPSDRVRYALLLFFIDCGLLQQPDAAPFMTMSGAEDIGFYVYSDFWTETLDELEVVTRAAFIEVVDDMFRYMYAGWLTNDLKARFAARNDPMTSAMLAYPTGPDEHDHKAQYAVTRIEAFHSGEKVLFGSAHAETIMYRRSVQAVILRRILDVDELESMRDEIESLLDDLLAANPDSDN